MFQRWHSLISQKDEVKELIEGVRFEKIEGTRTIDLHAGLKLTVNPPFHVVNIRDWYIDEQEVERPTRRGVCLKFYQWEHLMEAMDEIKYHLPEINAFHNCFEDHENLEGALDCAQCCP